MSDQQLVDAAFNGLLPHIKDKYASQEFESISQIASRMTGETRSYESKKACQKMIRRCGEIQNVSVGYHD